MEPQEKLLLSRAEDTLRLAEKHYTGQTLGFLTPSERVFLQKHILPPTDMRLSFEGGYPDAERTLMVCTPEFLEEDADSYLAVIACRGRDLGELSHRDYLGSLMGLGIVRESIGDILPLAEKAFIILKPEQADFVMQNLTKIGRHGIKTERCTIAELELPQKQTKEIQTTVSALRLDSVLASALGVSRGSAAEYIRAKRVMVNWEETENLSRTLREGDVFSVRGHGRFCLAHVGGITRKGRQNIVICRYI